MLVMVTLYQTVNDNIPTTLSLKMIDLWMLFFLAIPLLEVILHSAMAWIRQRYDLENTKKRLPKEVVNMANQTDEFYRKRSRTSTARKGIKTGPHKQVTKRLIKEAIKEVLAATAARDDKNQPGEIEIDTRKPKRPDITKIALDEKDQRTRPKRILRYFVCFNNAFCLIVKIFFLLHLLF
jgi:hypothetical protein